jgi:hypothetical protein
MEQIAKRQLENQLMKMGFARLRDPELVQQFAFLVNQWGKHEFFQSLLGECDADKRVAMYEALKPHLSFEPLPLEHYMSKIKERASNVASSANAITLEDQVAQAAARGAVEGRLKLTCKKCTFVDEFAAPTLQQAYRLARERGWVSDGDSEICPKCPAVRTA